MTELHAEALMKDPRIAEAKKLLLDAVEEHQNGISTIKEADPDLQDAYKEMLESYGQQRGGKLWFPYLGSGIGNGCLVELADGSVKYDMICGIGPHYWGHSHRDITESAIEAALSDLILQGNLQQNADSVSLTKLLIKASGMDHCFISTSGAMACENALKIIFQKQYPASRILAFEKCFMGRSLALAQLTDKAAYRDGLPQTLDVDYIPFFDYKAPQESTEKAVSALTSHLHRHPGQYAAMCFELVQGEGGFYPGTRDFFVAIMDILKENGIRILIDEVQTFGRTYKLFAFQHFALESYVDVVAIGKLSQVCATLFHADLKPRPGLLSQTFTSTTAAIRAGKTIIENLLSGTFFGPDGKIAQVHHDFKTHLLQLEQKYPDLIEGPHGIGTMLAFTVFRGDKGKTLDFIHRLYDNGVIAFVAGTDPMRVRFLVPIGVITKGDIDSICKIIGKTLQESQETTP